MKLKFLFAFLFAFCLVSCNDDNIKPITLKDREGTRIGLIYPNESQYSCTIQGGDGNYMVKSGDNKIVTIEMVSFSEFNIGVVGLGETTIAITDRSKNTLILNVIVDYLTHSFRIVKHDIVIVGGDLTENEKKAIREKHLSEIPVKVGGGYKFIHTDAPNRKGKAIIYTESYAERAIETTFIKKEFEGMKVWGYEIAINNEKRTLVFNTYTPSFSRSTALRTMALMEDITAKVQIDYPKAELVYTSQVIGIP